jgi:DDE superfamily endonuclease
MLVVLPPHSTHRLQPLDVGIFSPLANAYSNELDRLIQSSHGFTRMTKRNFWRLFSTAWTSAFTIQNIMSAFAAPGLVPLNPSKVLDDLKKKTPSPASSDIESKKTPISVRGLRRKVKQMYKEPQAKFTQSATLIIRASQKLAVQNEIILHENEALRKALIDERNYASVAKPWDFLTRNMLARLSFSHLQELVPFANGHMKSRPKVSTKGPWQTRQGFKKSSRRKRKPARNREKGGTD